MNDYLIYLCLPPYLAQWYAHECNQVHNRDKATCPRWLASPALLHNTVALPIPNAEKN